MQCGAAAAVLERYAWEISGIIMPQHSNRAGLMTMSAILLEDCAPVTRHNVGGLMLCLATHRR